LKISGLEKLVREGRYTDIDRIYPEKPFYITSTSGKIKWALLNIRGFIEQEPPKLNDAYLACKHLLKLHLLEEEKNDIKLRQVLILLLLEDTKKARDVFKEVKESKDEDSFCEILNLKAIFDEKNGKFEEARRSLLSAVGKYDSKENLQLAKIYNNLGRMERMLGNTTNVLHYYRKSASLARRLKNKNLLHTVYPNLIDAYLLSCDNKNALNSINEYKSFIDKDNIDDLLRFYNYLLVYSRQTKNTGLMINTLKDTRTYVYPHLSHDKQLIFESSELRIRWNLRYEWDKKLFWVEDHLSEYLSLQFPENYLSLKEAFIILFDLAKANNLGPFYDLFSQLVGFMGNIKKDIEQHIISLPDYCVNERCFWETELAFLSKITKSNEPEISLIDFYERMFKHLSNIKDINLEHENPILAIKMDLDIADECMGAIQAINDKSVKDYLKNKMTDHLNKACKEIISFEKHPASNEYFIRISMYSLFLGDNEKSREYLNKFDDSGISINHYSKWIQDYYIYLKNSTKTKV
jgi:tetratricopeptide (TPR) repeat protein